jgi:hypothetical protein
MQGGLQLAILQSSRLVEGCGLWTQSYIDGRTLGFIRPLEIGSVALGGITMASTLRSPTLHHPLEHGSFAEEIELLELLF